jgi:diguanylate cyclase (GGDEF)-like protein
MKKSEELRETILSMRYELDALRQELDHANTLLKALDALLMIPDKDDPFVEVFKVLTPTFDIMAGIVLVRLDAGSGELECVSSTDRALAGTHWKSDARLDKALRGRIVTTLSGHGLGACIASGTLAYDDDQPVLYLPVTHHGHSGVLILLRAAGKAGFGRSDVTLARKFSLLASHALAVHEAKRIEIEGMQLRRLTDKLIANEHELKHQANHDMLTGLPNRVYVQKLVDERLSRKRPGEHLALVFMDIDDFKLVNDHHGHAVGDLLLRGIADRIRAGIRSSDIPARVSGDEFVIVLDPVGNADQINLLAQRISENLRPNFEIAGVSLKGTGSLGVAIYPQHGRDYETLRRNADTAMYWAKTTSKGSIGFFHHSASQAMSERQIQEQELRAALLEKRFHSALQSKVDIATGGLLGYEMMLRWVDRDGVVHLPPTFLRAADDFELLDGIVLLQLDEILSWLPKLDAGFGDKLIYNLNTSTTQILKPSFMNVLVERIVKSRRAHSFTLELTEESFLQTSTFKNHVLPLLRDNGIKVSINAFGASYPSLSIFADSIVHEIKIDCSYIIGIQNRKANQSILRSIETLAGALKVPLVAKGVETLGEVKYLKENTGIRVGQGFVFSHPTFIPDLLNARQAEPPAA